MIFLIVVIGGITRLGEAGLSIGGRPNSTRTNRSRNTAPCTRT
jgi:hypothetical protein